MSQKSPQDYLQQALLAGDARRAAARFNQLRDGLTLPSESGTGGNDHEARTPADLSIMNRDLIALRPLRMAAFEPTAGDGSRADQYSPENASQQYGLWPGGMFFDPDWGRIPERLGRRKIGDTEVLINDVGLKNELLKGNPTIGAAIEFVNIQPPGTFAETGCKYKYFNYAYRDMFWKAFSPPWDNASTEEGKLAGQIPGAAPGQNYEKRRQLDIGKGRTSPSYYPNDRSNSGDCIKGGGGSLICVKTDWAALDHRIFDSAAGQAKEKLTRGCSIICVYAIQYFEAWFAEICGERMTVKTVSSVRVDSNRCYDCATMRLMEGGWEAPDSDTSEESAVAGRNANFKDEFIKDIHGFGGDWAKLKISFS